MGNDESRRPHNWFYNHVSGRWELRSGKQGAPAMSIEEAGFNIHGRTGTLGAIDVLNVANLGQARVGGGGNISLIKKFTGTLPATTVGTGQTGVATMTGVASAGIAVGDIVFGNAKGALSDGGIAGWIVPTTNVVTARLSSGAFPNIGVDIVVLRTT